MQLDKYGNLRSYHIGISILMLLIVTACLPLVGRSLPDSTSNILPYPNALNLNTQDMSKDPNQTWQVVTFQTQDAPKAVLDYYANELSKDDWYSSGGTIPQAGQLTLFCCSADEDASFFSITVETQQASNGQTNVKVELYEELPF
jgi:hypothetical protein